MTCHTSSEGGGIYLGVWRFLAEKMETIPTVRPFDLFASRGSLVLCPASRNSAIGDRYGSSLGRDVV